MSQINPIALLGAGPIGRGLAHQLAVAGVDVHLYNRTTATAQAVRDSASRPEQIVVADTVGDAVAALDGPRVIISAVSDRATPQTLTDLVPLLSRGDVVVDISNADAEQTHQRQCEFGAQGLHLLAGGLASGEHGATYGASLTVSGDRAAFAIAEPQLTSVAAVVQGRPCLSYVGAGSASHLVKTIHNGLEYSIMQLLAEVIVALRDLSDLAPVNVAATLRTWNRGYDSYIVEVAAETADHRLATDVVAIDVAEDRVDHNGSGARAAIHSMQSNVLNPAAAISILARLSSDQGRTGDARSTSTTAPRANGLDPEAVRETFEAAMALMHANTLEHLRRTAQAEAGSFDPEIVWDTWRGATVGSSFHADAAVATEPPQRPTAWKEVAAAANESDIGLPMISGLLSFAQSRDQSRSFASVLQVMRNRLGGSKFEVVGESVDV